VSEVKDQFASLLADIGFMKRTKGGSGKGKRGNHGRRGKGGSGVGGGGDGGGGGASGAAAATEGGKEEEDDNAYSHVLQLVKAVCCAGLYPNVLVVPQDQWPMKEGQKCSEVQFQSRKGPVSLHPMSINYKQVAMAHY
jgi:hypothetical protein